MKLRDTTIGRSIFRSPDRVTERDQAAGHWSNFFLHIYPVKMKRKEIGFRYSYYLGVISTVLLGSLVAERLKYGAPQICIRPNLSTVRVLDFRHAKKILKETMPLKDEAKRLIEASIP